MGLSVQTVAATHAPDHGRGDAFGIRHRFVGRHVVGQIVFVDAPEGSQECTQAGARTFTTVAVNFAHPIAIIITRPFPSHYGKRSRAGHARPDSWRPHRCRGWCCQLARCLQ